MNLSEKLAQKRAANAGFRGVEARSERDSVTDTHGQQFLEDLEDSHHAKHGSFVNGH